jgi:ankyrin repeat protein
MQWSLALDTVFNHRIGCTPLHQSVSNILSDSIIHEKIHDYQNPIHLDIMNLLINSNANPNKFWESETVLHTAIKNRNKEVVALLLDANANPNLK